PPAAGGAASKPAAGNPLAKAAPADPFARRFRGENIELELAATDAGYRGKLVFQGNTYPAEAKAKDASLTGRFQSGTDWFDFTATLTGDKLKLDSGGSSYELVGAPLPPANPLAKSGAGAAAGAGADAPPALDGVFDGKATRFDHPRGW